MGVLHMQPGDRPGRATDQIQVLARRGEQRVRAGKRTLRRFGNSPGAVAELGETQRSERQRNPTTYRPDFSAKRRTARSDLYQFDATPA